MAKSPLLQIFEIQIVLLTVLSLVFAGPPLLNELDYELDFFGGKGVSTDLIENVKPGSSGTKEAVIRSVIPNYYRLRLRPLFDPLEDSSVRFTAPGQVEIWVDCVQVTKTIILNTKEIEIKVLKVTSRNTHKDIPVSSHSTDALLTTFTIELGESLEVGQPYKIYIEYVAKVFRDRLNGLYLSNYTDPTANYEMKYLATTHFEPKDARQMFPSFDEPDLKSIFDVSVERREKYNTLSNMNLFKSEPIQGEEGWYVDHFNSTVEMSTYLIAVVVSEFVSETADESLFPGRTVKAWGSKHKVIDWKGGIFPAYTIANILRYYEEYFEVKYPLPKMDSVEIPHFGAGAMENYGLNTYRDNYLLYFPGTDSEFLRYQIAKVIAHELGHQWFGDLVTTKTWPHIWLNEGFASYVEELGTDAVYPEFETWKLFVPNTLQLALQFDQSPSSHPIVDETYSEARFDTITYKKGASLIRMMKGFLGEDVLRAGLKHYLEKFSFGNAHQDDLFEALQDAADKAGTFPETMKIGKIMESWTLQKGYPLVRVLLADDLNTIYMTQEPFIAGSLTKDPNTSPDAGKRLWWIPLTVSNRVGNLDFWISNTEKSLLKVNVDTSDLLILNPDAVGYYRVLYDEVLTQRIKTQLENDHTLLSPNTRCQLLDDYFNFAWSNYLTIEKPLDLGSYLSKETELNVWTTVFKHFQKTYNLLSRTSLYDGFRDYLRPKINSVAKIIDYRNKPEDKGAIVLLRSRLADWGCAMEDQDCENYAITSFQNWLTSPLENPLSIDLQSTILCTGISRSGDSEWNDVFEKYKKMIVERELKKALLRSLACSKNPDTITRFLEKTLDPSSGIRKEDVPTVYQNIIANSVRRYTALDFIWKQFSTIVDYLGTPQPLYTLLDSFAKYLYTEEDLNNLQTFVNTHSKVFQPVSRKINSTFEAIRNNKIWVDKFYEPMKLWFDKKPVAVAAVESNSK